MPMKPKILHTLAFVGPMLASIIAGNSASATIILSNGGTNFQTAGPRTTWRYDQGAGFCSSARGTWCQPRNAQWVYSTNTFAQTNNATWTVPQQYRTQIASRVSAFISARNATSTVAPYDINYMEVSRYNPNRFSPSETKNYINQLKYYNEWVQIGSQAYPWVDSVFLSDKTFETPTTKVSFDEIKIEN